MVSRYLLVLIFPLFLGMNLLGRLITQACLYAIPKGGSSFSTDNIRVQKILGGGI
jgi:hypothetical protein